MDKTAYVLLGVALGVLLNAAKEWLFQRDKIRKDREYLTVRFACTLDTFVTSCTDVVADDGLSYGQPGPDGCRSVQVKAPSFDPYVIAVEWKSLPATLMYEILNFPNLVEAANHQIAGAFKYSASPPDYEEGFEERQLQYAYLGLKAHELSKRLRKTGGFPFPDTPNPEGWDSVRFMVEKVAGIQDLREQRAARHKGFRNYNDTILG